MKEEDKLEIIEAGKQYFRTIIIPRHLDNLRKLRLSDFKINPFLVNYLAAFLCGDTTPQSIAKALVYPRVLGTSINTSFGQNIQIFISSLAQITGSASGIAGVDIEFIDAEDGRRKYCQCKAGPETINSDDVATIMGHFAHLQNKARLDRLDINIGDLIVGVLYGEKSQLSGSYKKIDQTYPVYCGAEFWRHLTGDQTFYLELSKAFGEVVEEDGIDGSEMIRLKVEQIEDEIIRQGGI